MSKDLEKLLTKWLKKQNKHVLTVTSDGKTISVDFDGNTAFLLFNAVATVLQNDMDEELLDETIRLAKEFVTQQRGK